MRILNGKMSIKKSIQQINDLLEEYKPDKVINSILKGSQMIRYLIIIVHT